MRSIRAHAQCDWGPVVQLYASARVRLSTARSCPSLAPLSLSRCSTILSHVLIRPPPSRVSNVINGEVTFGLVPHDHWYQPDWIDEERAKAGREKMVADNIIYGGSVSYRNMCRFNSGVSAPP